MQFTLFLEDLSDEWVSRVKETLRYDLADEIEEAVGSGTPRNTAEQEIIGDYLNRHNVGFPVNL